MRQELEKTSVLLERTPAALNALLRGLPQFWSESREGERTWSVRMVVAHLVYCEHANWMPRVRMILERGEQQTFVPLDRNGSVCAAAGKTVEQLLDELAEARRNSLDELRRIDWMAEDFERRGRHPALGSVTLSELLATWAAHDLTHLHQITRIMAHQMREAVGPWARFLGVLQCAGHGEAG